MTRQKIKKAKRIVVKVGASVLTCKRTSANRDAYCLDKPWIKDFVSQVSLLMKDGYEVSIVSSGAIAAGMGLLGIKKRPKGLPEQQAAAALGQSFLIRTYDDFFRKKGLHAGQILLTWDDIRERHRYLNAENTLSVLLKKKIVPVINENDTVSVDEIKFGDNDKLSALVASIIDADLLIILTDVDGLFSVDGKTCIDYVEQIDASLEKLCRGTDKEYSLGGMRTKLDACKIATIAGIDCVIANGRKKDILLRILEGENIGTFFASNKARMQARKRWIAYNARPHGRIFIDEGAQKALKFGNKSLLPCGIGKMDGKFNAGDVVLISGMDGTEFAKGLSNYSSEDLNKIKGLNTPEIEKIIKEGFYIEAVHRDNMVIL